jgi:carboxyl-terminal processing protease
MSAPHRSFSILVVGIVCGACMVLGYTAWAGRDSRTAQPRPSIAWQDAELFAEVFELIKQDYVEEIPDRGLTEAAIHGLVDKLDTFSSYLDPEEFAEMRRSTAGEYSGVGVEISLTEGTMKIVDVLQDSPADRAGVRAADSVVAIDNIPIEAANLADSVERMRGKPGSRVKLTISRTTAPQPFDVVVTRGTVQVRTVQQRLLEPGYAYVRITQFNDNTAADFSQALTTLQNDGELRGLVLDLRGNPGGLLNAAVNVADAVLDHGMIVTAEGRANDAKFAMAAHSGDLMRKAPIAVLVNGASASAAEIVAGALKDHKRAVLIGQTTFGKGSVQSVLPLATGGALKLTTSLYRTPSGVSLHKQGIVPDVVIDPAPIDAHAQTHTKTVAEDAAVQVALAQIKTRP